MKSADAASALSEGLDPEQREAVMSPSPLLCVVAGAGSGKTRVLTRRVARRILDGSAEAQHTLVLTFTRKAADELRHRLRILGAGDDVTTGTFHAVAYAQLRRRWLDQGRTVPVVTAQPLRMLDNVLQSLRLGRTTNPRTVAAEISWAKSRRLTPETYEEGVRQYRRRPPLSLSQIIRVYEAYESEKRKRRTVDYDDLLLLLTDALTKDKAFASAQRWRFRHLYVDEFQDLNNAQFDLLRAWRGGRDDLFLVGDPNQAIYGWNGADASYLIDAEHHFPGVDVVRLRTNYRSTAHVLAAAAAVLPGASEVRPTGQLDPLVPETGPAPVVRSFGDEREEALAIAREVRLVHSRSRRWADIAILVRTNAQRSVIEQALEDAKIPFRSAGGAAWLYRSEVRTALDHLREVPRSPLGQRAADLEQMAQEVPDGRRGYLDELIAAVRQCLTSDPEMTIADFLSWIEVASHHDGPAMLDGDGGAVTVTTFHRAKGLEWPVVFLSGVEDGLVPHGTPSGAQLDEERRLFYVAVTRAREELHCSWAQKRETRAGVALRSPSPWLAAIEQASVGAAAPPPDPETAREVIRESREALRVDDELSAEAQAGRDALRRWRAARAKLTGIPARLILSDDLVDAIIDLRPASPQDLSTLEGFGPVRAASIGDDIVRLFSSPAPIGGNVASSDEGSDGGMA